MLFSTNLTNLPIKTMDGKEIRQGAIHVERVRLIWEDRLYERLTLSNYGQEQSTIQLSLRFAADFRDMFEVRGTVRQKRGTARLAEAGQNSIVLRYHGLDDIERVSAMSFSQMPDQLMPDQADFFLTLAKRGK